MSKIYVDEILPKDNAKITAADLQLPAGSVIQVITYNETDTDSWGISTTSTSFVSTGKSVTITPRSTSSKIVLMANFNANGNASGDGLVFKFYRNSSAIGSNHGQIWYTNGATNFHGAQNLLYTDEPSSTSATTYTLYYKSNSGGQCRIAQDWQSINLVAMEIAG